MMGSKITSTATNRQEIEIQELEAKNQALREVLHAAKRMLRARRTLDDALMKELDRGVNAVEQV